MNILEIFKTIDLGEAVTKSGLVAVVICTLLQISPIKINPWSWIATHIGRAINRELISKVDSLGSEVKQIKDSVSENDARSCRNRIVRFGDELRQGVLHSQEHFEQILTDITAYENYCAAHEGFKNNIAVLTIHKIKETYTKCMDKNSFL